jgi:uncharacterized protein (DUF2236 family)
MVTRSDLEAALADLAAEIDDPLAGIHGPGSLGWRYGREAQNFLGAGRAALMQLAHAPVARAIESHSRVLVDVRGRFQRTFDNVFAMTFGDLDHAIRSARRVHNVHVRITGEHSETAGRYRAGSRYAANEVDSLRWVYATLVDSVFAVREFVGRPLPPSIAERYYRESTRFARLFGLSPSQLPASARELDRYVAGCLEDGTVAVSAAAASIAGALLEAPRPALEPLAAAYRAMTGALLPAPLAEAFGLPRTGGSQFAGRALAVAIDRGVRMLPRRLRYVPGYLSAEGRCGRRTRLERRLDRAAEQMFYRLAG